MSKSLTNKPLLKKKFFGLKMAKGLALDQHINVLNQMINDINPVDMKFNEEDMTLILLNSLSPDSSTPTDCNPWFGLLGTINKHAKPVGLFDLLGHLIMAWRNKITKQPHIKPVVPFSSFQKPFFSSLFCLLLPHFIFFFIFFFFFSF